MIFEIEDKSALTCKIPDPTGRMLKLLEQYDMFQAEEEYKFIKEFVSIDRRITK